MEKSAVRSEIGNQKNVPEEVAKAMEFQRTIVTIRGAIGGFERSDYVLVLNSNYPKEDITTHLLKGDKWWFYQKTIKMFYGDEIPQEGWKNSFDNILAKKGQMTVSLDKRIVSVEHETIRETRVAVKPKQLDTTTVTVSVGTLTYNLTVLGHVPSSELEEKLKDQVWLARNINNATYQEMSGSARQVKQEQIPEMLAYITGEKRMSGSEGPKIIGKPDYGVKRF